MTRNRARTRAIRARMAQTGEPYTLAARRHDAEHGTTPHPSPTPVAGQTIERTYPAADWLTDPTAIIRAFRADASTEATRSGLDWDTFNNVTAYLENTDGTPNASSPDIVRIRATWTAPSTQQED